ncbi:MAG: nucleotidyltransferase domain-containing protein [Lachnospiraceae bacterium]|nr:nucleotidyltransferase domain-containing protein [Lachnospiraceae bacterium]
MTLESIRNAVLKIVPIYPIKKVTLFGSRADGTYRENSDVDLIMEFSKPISLFILAEIKFHLEDLLGVAVDIIHGPIRDTDFLQTTSEVELYAA